MTYKGREIDESYHINEWEQEKIYSGSNHHESFERDEIKDFYLKALAKERQLQNNSYTTDSERNLSELREKISNARKIGLSKFK